MAVKTFTSGMWIGVWNKNVGTYHGGGNPMSIGGIGQRHTFIGFPEEVRTALKTSLTTPELRFKFYVTDNFPDWAVGAHKDAFNKASDNLPWFTSLQNYNGVGLYWQNLLLTYNFMDAYMAGTYQGIVLYSRAPVQDYNYGEAFGITSSSNTCYIEVTGTWNDPPNKTKVTYPTGGEIINTELTAKWDAGTDPDGNSGLSYRVGISTGDGGWKYYTTSATSYKIDTSNMAEQQNARIAVEVLDSYGATSGWVYSNYFTISHNEVPKPPSNVSPANGAVYDRSEVIRFSWKHNDDGAQAGYQHAWRTVADDGTRGAWNYYPTSAGGTFKDTTAQYYNMPANTLPFGNIEWGVRTKDQDNQASPWSIYQIFLASNPSTAPTILSPLAGNYNSQDLQISWSTINQLEYQVLLKSSTGSTLWSTTGTGSNKSVVPTYQLQNGKTYTVSVRSKSSDNQLWSDYANVTFTTAFTPPHPPVLERYEEAGEGVLNWFYKSADVNILPDFIVGEGVKADIVTPYSAGGYTLNSKDSVTADIAQANYRSGIMMYLTDEHIPLIAGAKYTVSATADIKGGRVYIEGLDSNGDMTGYGATTSAYASSTAGTLTASYTLPANVVKIRVIFFVVADAPAGTYTLSDCKLQIENTSAPTGSIDVLRREYTPEGLEPWVTTQTALEPSGSFLDYTPASGVTYEYKIVATSTTGTTNESTIKQAQVFFDSTLLNPSKSLSGVVLLPFCTSREAELEIENKLSQFAGRVQPVREFGEHETVTIELEWEVDSYNEVKQFRNLMRTRDVFLYRDFNGRRYWVTSGELKVEDKEIQGFVLSTEFTVTSYNEDVKGEGS
jgi:hypothetical protein